VTEVSETLNDRELKYGAFGDLADATQAFKAVARQAPSWAKMTSIQRESTDMILLKLSRVLYGDPLHFDSWHDIAGYATLAGEEFGTTLPMKPAPNPEKPVDLLEKPAFVKDAET
jgi:hypothetical protein